MKFFLVFLLRVFKFDRVKGSFLLVIGIKKLLSFMFGGYFDYVN